MRLLVSSLGACQIRLRAKQLRIRARISARHIFPRTRHIHSRGTRFALCQRQRRFGLVQRRLVIARIDLYQHLSRFHRLVVIDQNLRHAPVHFRRHRRDVPVYLRVVRSLAIVIVGKEPCDRGQRYGPAANQQPPHAGIG